MNQSSLTPPTPIEIKAFRARRSLSQVRFAELIGSSRRTIEAWERDENPNPAPPMLRLVMAAIEHSAPAWYASMNDVVRLSEHQKKQSSEVDIKAVVAELDDAQRRLSELPYSVAFEIDHDHGWLIARGTEVNGLRVNGATTGRPLAELFSQPKQAWNYIFGFLQASLRPAV